MDALGDILTIATLIEYFFKWGIPAILAVYGFARKNPTMVFIALFWGGMMLLFQLNLISNLINEKEAGQDISWLEVLFRSWLTFLGLILIVVGSLSVWVNRFIGGVTLFCGIALVALAYLNPGLLTKLENYSPGEQAKVDVADFKSA